jgi:hypothetical protein
MYLLRVWDIHAGLGYAQYSPSNRCVWCKHGVGTRVQHTRILLVLMQNTAGLPPLLVPLFGLFCLFLWSSGTAASGLLCCFVIIEDLCRLSYCSLGSRSPCVWVEHACLSHVSLPFMRGIGCDLNPTCVGCIGFRTGTVRVGLDDTAPAPLDTAPLQGWGTHRTRFFKVLMLNRGSI